MIVAKRVECRGEVRNCDNLTFYSFCILWIYFWCVGLHVLYWKGVGLVHNPISLLISLKLPWVFPQVSIMLAMELSYAAFIMLRYISSSPIPTRNFRLKTHWILLNYSIYSDGHVIFWSPVIWLIIIFSYIFLAIPTYPI